MSMRTSITIKAVLVCLTLGVKFASAGPLNPTQGVTTAEARAALSSTAPVIYSTSTGVIAISSAGAFSNGYLKSTDWNTFNNRVSTFSVSSPLALSGSAISISSSSASQNGYLKSADWTTFNSKQASITAGTTSQYWRGDKTFQTLDTSVVPENSNLYFTTARARLALTATSPAFYNNTTGVISISSAGASSSGYLTNANWVTFNAKQGVFTAASPLSFNGSQISISSAGSSSNGFLTYSDWNTFNNRLSTITFTAPLTTSGTSIGVDKSSVTLQGNVFNGNLQLVQTTGNGKFPPLNGSIITSITAANIAAGSLGGGVIASSIAVASVGVPQLNFTGSPGVHTFARGDGQWANAPGVSSVTVTSPLTLGGTTVNPIIGINASSVTLQGNVFNSGFELVKLSTGLILNELVDGSSVTKQGNLFNGQTQLVQTDSSGFLPALNASALTSLTAPNLTGLVPNASVDPSSVTKRGNVFNGASQLVLTDSSSKVPNANLDSSSVTKQGNTFNGTSQLVQTTSGGIYPALDGSSITNLTATNLTGTIANARIDSSSVTKQGNIFNGVSQLVQTDTNSKVPNANIDSSSVTKQGNVFNGASQLVQTDTNSKIANANIDSSSVTKQGNTFNGNSQLVQTTSGGLLPVLSAANLTSIPAGNLTGTVPNASIDSSSVTKQGNSFNGATQLVQTDSGSKVPNANIDSSSVTKQGNVFNGASQLVKLDGSSALPTASGANLTSLNASNLASGTVPSAQLGNALLTSGGTLTGSLTFSNTANFGVVGSTTNNSATTGNVGEYVQSVVSNVSTGLSGVNTDITSISLTAGDWDVTLMAFVQYVAASTTLVQNGIGTTAGDNQTGFVFGSNATQDNIGSVGGNARTYTIAGYRMSLASTTTVYGKTLVTFGGGSPTSSMRLSARRMR